MTPSVTVTSIPQMVQWSAAPFMQPLPWKAPYMVPDSLRLCSTLKQDLLALWWCFSIMWCFLANEVICRAKLHLQVSASSLAAGSRLSSVRDDDADTSHIAALQVTSFRMVKPVFQPLSTGMSQRLSLTEVVLAASQPMAHGNLHLCSSTQWMH